MSNPLKSVNDREIKRQTYEYAMKDLEDGVPLHRAAKQWGIADSTLRDRYNGKYKQAGKGKIPILTAAEEDRLVDWLVERSKRGFGLSIDEFLDSVRKFIEKDKRATPFKENRPGRKWYRGFIKRNPKVRLRNARPSDKKRAKISAADLDNWFTEYEQFMRESRLINRPAQIWNRDETGFDLQGKAGKVLGPSARKDQPFCVVTGSKEHITVLPCFNALGQWIPPYVLFAGKRVPTTYNPLEGGVPGSAFSFTEKGYMDAASFYMWLANHFIPNIPPARSVVLLIGSAEAHIDLQTFELAKENQVHIFALLKNATHLVQPADVGLFGAMKQAWYKNVRRFSQKHPNTDITKKNFCGVFKSTWDEVMHPSTLADAFRKSGTYPVCREQITDDHVESSLVYAGNDQSTACTPLSQASQSFLPEQSVLVSTTHTPFITSAVSVVSYRKQSASLDATCTPLTQVCESLLPNDENVLLGATRNVSRQLDYPRKRAYSDAFDALESVLESPVKAKYRRRIEEGYNLDGSPTFKTWKKLRTAASKPTQLTSEPRLLPPTFSSSTPWPNAASSSSLAVSPVIEEITVYPLAPEKSDARRKNAKKTLLNFLTGEASMKIVLDAKLKKARELAAKQKKLREKEERKEAKRREQEAKKWEMQERRKKKNQKATEKKRNANERNKRTTNGKHWRRSLPQTNKNCCKVCWQEYSPSDDEKLPWVMCDKCELWMHIGCHSPIDNGEQFFCHDCS